MYGYHQSSVEGPAEYLQVDYFMFIRGAYLSQTKRRCGDLMKPEGRAEVRFMNVQLRFCVRGPENENIVWRV
jgi:hypothetical protein